MRVSPSPQPIPLQPVLRRCRALLKKHYGDRFAGLIQYGSTVRGTADPESDLDLLVLFRGPFDYFEELERLTALVYPVQLDADRQLSVLPASEDEFEAGKIQLYRNAAREGIRC
jgi:predicted nucleotidyltransferase